MTTTRALDIEKVLESRSSIVKDNNRILLPDLKSVFTGSSLVDWIFTNYNLTNTDKLGITELIQQELANPAFHHQLVYPVEEGDAFINSEKQYYRFIDSHYREMKKDKHILNLYGADTAEYHFFYEKKEAESITSLLDELNIVMEEIYGVFLDDTKTLVDYIKLEESEVFNAKLLPILTKLAYADLSSINQNQNQLKTFFINIYNILSIHAVIAHYRKEKKLSLSLVERPSFYASFKYNIAGHNYTLSDIEQGILRRNSSMAVNFASAVLDFAFGTKSKGDRFNLNDPRRKFVLLYLDPRIHFALNPGTMSCPAYRYYTAEELDNQLEVAAKEFCQNTWYVQEDRGWFQISELFKFYKSDFVYAATDYSLMNYVISYVKDEDRDRLSQQIEERGLQLKYFSYNWDLNKRFNS